jgi:hypothetical protein
MSKNKDKITRENGAVWDTVKFNCPYCGNTNKFEFHMIDDEQHFIMRCVAQDAFRVYDPTNTTCGWQSERYCHLPSDIEPPIWPYEPASDEVKTVEVLVPVEEDEDTILEVADFRGKDCDVILPAMADAFEVTEER